MPDKNLYNKEGKINWNTFSSRYKSMPRSGGGPRDLYTKELDYLKSKLEEKGFAGDTLNVLMANAIEESGGNPKAVTDNYNGLYQIDKRHYKADTTKTYKELIDEQVEYLKKYLDTVGDRGFLSGRREQDGDDYRYGKNDHEAPKNEFWADNTSLENRMYAFVNGFERPGNRKGTYQNRLGVAKILSEYGIYDKPKEASDYVMKELAGVPKFDEGGEKEGSWKPSDDIIDFMIKYEGFIDEPRIPTKNDVLTTGYGVTDKDIVAKNKGRKITREEALEDFKVAVNRRVDMFRKATPNFEKFTDQQKDALFDYYYNIGHGNYTKKSPKFQKALRDMDYSEILRQMDADENNPNRRGAAKRRYAERNMFFGGLEQEDMDGVIEDRLAEHLALMIRNRNALEKEYYSKHENKKKTKRARKKSEGGEIGDSDLVLERDNTYVSTTDPSAGIPVPYNINLNDSWREPVPESPYARSEQAYDFLNGLNNTVGTALKGAAYAIEAPYTLMQVLNLAKGTSLRMKAAKLLSDNMGAASRAGVATDIADFVKDPSYENLIALFGDAVLKNTPDLTRPLNKAARSYGTYDTTGDFYESAKDAYESVIDGEPGEMEYGGTTRDEAEDYIFSYLTSNGFKEPQAIAIIANLIGESGLQANVTRKGGSDFGLQQWIGHRKKALYEYAREMGHEEPTFDDQLDFLIKEYKGEVPGSGWNFQTKGMNLHKGNPSKFGKEWDYYQYGRSEFENADSVANATVMYNQGFGRAYKQNLRNDFRIKQAERLAEKFGLDMGLPESDNEDMSSLALAQNTSDQILPESDHMASSEDRFDRWFEDYGRDFVGGVDYGRIGDEVSSSLQPLISKMGSVAVKENKEEDNVAIQNRDAIIDSMVKEALAALNFNVKGMSKEK